VTPTIRKNKLNVNLSAAAQELLNYRVQVIQGAGAIYGWSDDNETAILPLPDSPAVADVKWQLKSALVGGKVQLTVPQNPGYVRNETSPLLTVYGLTLLFPTAIKYTLTIDHCDVNGNVIENLVDIDFTRDQGNDQDSADHVESVSI
jgi:hypothetical protein